MMSRLATSLIRCGSLAVVVCVLSASSCNKPDSDSQGSGPSQATTQATTQASSSVSGTDSPAFHGGGPLLGAALSIGAPPMRVRWTYKADSDTAGAPPATQSSGVTPAFESSAAIVKGLV